MPQRCDSGCSSGYFLLTMRSVQLEHEFKGLFRKKSHDLLETRVKVSFDYTGCTIK